MREKDSRYVDSLSKEKKFLFIIQFFLVVVTVGTILMFYQCPEIKHWIKYTSTISLIVLCCINGHKLGLESGLRMGKRYKDEIEIDATYEYMGCPRCQKLYDAQMRHIEGYEVEKGYGE